MIKRRDLLTISVFAPVFIVALCLFSTVSPVFAQPEDEDKKFLLMYFKEEELMVESPTRSRKSITQTAENITVVTAEDIRLMNAHTVADVLNTVTGVQLFVTGGPGSPALASIQGSENRHVSVFMDGIPLNNLGDNVTDLGSLSVQNIEKIEIIKGPASSAWGSALGGVINIITKTGSRDKAGNVVSASYGERNTGDFRVEASGKESRLGYYLNAGRLQTDGFRPHNDFSGNNIYAKLSYDVTKGTSVFFTAGYDRLTRGVAEIPNSDLFVNNKQETFRLSLGANSALNKETQLSFSLWQMRQTFNNYNYQLSSGAPFPPDPSDNFEDKGYGWNTKLTYKQGTHNAVVGADYDDRVVESNRITGNDHRLMKWALFLNDTLSLGRMSVTPGIRYDHTNTNGEFTSPSLGITYKIADATLVRAYAARGFNLPPLSLTFGNNLFIVANPDLKMEKIESYELGGETVGMKYFWLKVSGFRHEVRDAILINGFGQAVNSERQRRQGMEIEAKTVPVYHTALTAGATYINAKDLNTGEKVKNVPQKTYDLGLQYDDEKSFKALLKGHYIYWNSQSSYQGKYDSFIFDLHLVKNLYTRSDQKLEAFMDVHNIFNGSQYAIDVYKNSGRWVEAGLRYSF